MSRIFAKDARIWAYLALIIGCIIAAGTFLVAKDTTQRFTPMQLTWFRINLSFLIILPIGLWQGKGSPRPSRSTFIRLIAMGIFGITINQMLFLHGIQIAPVIDGALLYSFTPALVLLGGRIFLKEALNWYKISGIAFAIVGVLLVLSEKGLALNQASLRGDLLILVAVIAWSAYTLLAKPVISTMKAIVANTWAFGIGAAIMLPMTPSVLSNMKDPGWEGWLGLFYLSAMTSVVSFTLWTWALKRLETAQVAIFANSQPFLTALLAWIFLNQLPTTFIVIGGVLIILGIFLTQKKPKTLPESLVEELKT